MFTHLSRKTRCILLLSVVLMGIEGCSKIPDSKPVESSSAVNLSTIDLVGRSETAGPDGKGDASVVIPIPAGGTVTGVTVATVSGQPAIWNTTPADLVWMVGVAAKETPQVLLNKPDGTINIAMDAPKDFVLYFADNGSVAAGNSKFEVTLAYADGTSTKITPHP